MLWLNISVVSCLILVSAVSARVLDNSGYGNDISDAYNNSRPAVNDYNTNNVSNVKSNKTAKDSKPNVTAPTVTTPSPTASKVGPSVHRILSRSFFLR
jgi:hypothetical protein